MGTLVPNSNTAKRTSYSVGSGFRSRAQLFLLGFICHVHLQEFWHYEADRYIYFLLLLFSCLCRFSFIHGYYSLLLFYHIILFYYSTMDIILVTLFCHTMYSLGCHGYLSSIILMLRCISSLPTPVQRMSGLILLSLTKNDILCSLYLESVSTRVMEGCGHIRGGF